MKTTAALDLGCGKVPRNPFNCESIYGVDINSALASKLICSADLNVEPIPFESNCFDVVTAYDFIEHVPRVLYYEGRRINPFIVLMNEISRVLKPGGVFFSSTPVYPHPAAFQDPTHVNIITEKTFINYFSIKHKCYGKMYGYDGELIFLGQYIHNTSHLRVTLIKDFMHEQSGISLFSSPDYLKNYEAVTGKLSGF